VTEPVRSPERPAVSDASHNASPNAVQSAAVALQPQSLRGPILKFVARRLALGIATLFVVSVLIFVLTNALRGDPASIILGRDATPEALAELRSEFGLDRPLLTRYGDWIRSIVTFDLGNSFASRAPIWDVMSSRVGASLFMLVCAGAVSIPLSIGIGAFAALRRDRGFDNVSSFVLLILAAMPEFVVGSLLVLVFATTITHLLPATTYLSPDDPPWSNLTGMILPVATLVLAIIPYVARVTRAAVLEVLESDYVEMARLKGVPERTVLWRHALPNALGPVFQVIALNLAYLAGGVIVVEWLFNFPGIGSALNDAVRFRDLPVVQFLALTIAAVYILTNLVADVCTVLATPRLRTALR
jgi:peptide/nickel transport system permease protein